MNPGRHPLAGQPAPPELLIDVARLERDFETREAVPIGHRNGEPRFVMFGTSGHRGSPFDGTFNRAHILAVTQAICDFRKARGYTGPLFLGKDTHAASTPAERAALEVLAANGVETLIQPGGGFTPTPAISRAILAHNRGRTDGLADGIVITPSHNPPKDGGFKYNPPNGGPADTDVTAWIEDRANVLLRGGNAGVRRQPYDHARQASTTREFDLLGPYVADLANVLDLAAVRAAGVRIGVDPLGGASLAYWPCIAEHYGLDLTVVNPRHDGTFAFMTLDHDGVIRMDCSSPYAMAGLLRIKDRFDVACGSDPDADRHGIVTPQAGLMNPNYYLATAIDYLLSNRPQWSPTVAVGKTLVSSSVIDRVAAAHGRALVEVPVGFKWFVEGLHSGRLCFGGEESAGASFLRRDGTVWTTDKDGILLGLLAAEIKARTGEDPGLRYERLVARFGRTYYAREDSRLQPGERERFKALRAEHVRDATLGGSPIVQTLTRAPSNNAPIGGLKVVSADGWFAVRPSGTEDLMKVYAESFKSAEHLQAILTEAREIVQRALRAAG